MMSNNYAFRCCASELGALPLPPRAHVRYSAKHLYRALQLTYANVVEVDGTDDPPGLGSRSSSAIRIRGFAAVRRRGIVFVSLAHKARGSKRAVGAVQWDLTGKEAALRRPQRGDSSGAGNGTRTRDPLPITQRVDGDAEDSNGTSVGPCCLKAGQEGSPCQCPRYGWGFGTPKGRYFEPRWASLRPTWRSSASSAGPALCPHLARASVREVRSGGRQLPLRPRRLPAARPYRRTAWEGPLSIPGWPPGCA